jgi:lipopolysaccharide export LptBFGC system permease protein LptF
MKRVTRYLAVIVCLLTIFSCNPFNIANQKIIEKFKATIKEDSSTTYDDYFTKLAGLRGEVNYSVFSDDDESNRDIKVIEVTIDKRDESVEFKTAKLQYLFNKKTGFIKLRYLEVNGEPQNLLTGTVVLKLMMLESTLM